jgi:hypothetical protein
MGPLLELGPSRDPVGLSALGLGLVLLAAGILGRARCRSWLLRGRSAWWVGGCALLAALLSAGYVVYFLRGGPRIIDATSYFLEARTFAAGKLTFAVPEPTGSFRGRFSLLGPEGLAVIFPPGYPLALALGFRLGAPLAVGPLLAALLVAATYRAAKELELGEPAARVAALLSALCAALRYHTADTMSHGLSALLLIASVTAALRPEPRRVVLAGLLSGWLCATRPLTGAVAVAMVGALVTLRSAPRRRPLLLLAAGASLLPGLALLACYQRAATGSFFHSTQLAYYALADGPPGCFRWGFGPNVGCRFEHAEFVRKHLEHGFGLASALYVTAERLLWHAFDIVNVAPLAALVPWLAWNARKNPGVRWAAVTVLLVVLAYLPFYFPGSYPGGGARLLADALPLEHVLVAAALTRLGLATVTPGVVVLGFALSTVHAHLALRERDGGRPMFDAHVLAEHGVTHGLVWVDSDHGFALGHDPAARDPKTSLIVARFRGDAHDRALWENLGRPASFRYGCSSATGSASLNKFEPPAERWRWEAEAEWPLLSASAGWAHPDFAPCLSRGRGLRLRPTPRAEAEAELELGAPRRGRYDLTVGWLANPGARLTLRLGEQAVVLAHDTGGCETTRAGPMVLEPTNRVALSTSSAIVLDYLELTGEAAK